MIAFLNSSVKERFADLQFPAVSTKCIHYLEIMNSKGYGNYETLTEDTEKKNHSFFKKTCVCNINNHQ